MNIEDEWIVRECLYDLNKDKRVNSLNLLLNIKNITTLYKNATIVQNIANKQGRFDIVERLQFANLIY